MNPARCEGDRTRKADLPVDTRDNKHDERPQEGFTAVILGSQFENATVNAMFVFDAANKVAGISFRPRP